jgi:hypothetical protein
LHASTAGGPILRATTKKLFGGSEDTLMQIWRGWMRNSSLGKDERKVQR